MPVPEIYGRQEELGSLNEIIGKHTYFKCYGLNKFRSSWIFPLCFNLRVEYSQKFQKVLSAGYARCPSHWFSLVNMNQVIKERGISIAMAQVQIRRNLFAPTRPLDFNLAPLHQSANPAALHSLFYLNPNLNPPFYEPPQVLGEGLRVETEKDNRGEGMQGTRGRQRFGKAPLRHVMHSFFWFF